MRNKLFSSTPSSCCGGANGDFWPNGWKPRNKKVFTNCARSERSLRIQSTTASTSSFSSANSRREMNDCFDASGGRIGGKATYKMLFDGFSTVSHMLLVFSVTCNLIRIRMGRFCCRIFLTTSWQSSSEQFDINSSRVESVKSISEYSDETLLVAESTDVFRL